MQIGSSPSEYTTLSSNQQNNQLIGKLPNWQSRLGIGTSGGGLNLNSLQSQNTMPLGKPTQPGLGTNPAMMIRALMAKRSA